MDKLYKPLLLQVVKEGMADLLPGFTLVKLTRGQPDAEVFSGSLLYCMVIQPDHAVWLCWQPDSGVERRFFVRLGWSPSREVLPIHGQHDSRIYGLSRPTTEFPACSLSLEQVLGRSAMGGFEIPSPWDQVYKLKPNAPRAEQTRIMQIAAAEAAALTAEDRLVAVRSTVAEVFSSLLPVIPSFIAPAGRGDA